MVAIWRLQVLVYLGIFQIFGANNVSDKIWQHPTDLQGEPAGHPHLCGVASSLICTNLNTSKSDSCCSKPLFNKKKSDPWTYAGVSFFWHYNIFIRLQAKSTSLHMHEWDLHFTLASFVLCILWAVVDPGFGLKRGQFCHCWSRSRHHQSTPWEGDLQFCTYFHNLWKINLKRPIKMALRTCGSMACAFSWICLAGPQKLFLRPVHQQDKMQGGFVFTEKENENFTFKNYVLFCVPPRWILNCFASWHISEHNLPVSDRFFSPVRKKLNSLELKQISN